MANFRTKTDRKNARRWKAGLRRLQHAKADNQRVIKGWPGLVHECYNQQNMLLLLGTWSLELAAQWSSLKSPPLQFLDPANDFIITGKLP